MTDRPSALESLRKASAKLLQTSQELRTLRAREREPIAIIGMGCRFPGGVETPEQLWRLVEAGGDTTGSFPRDRGWDLEALFHPDPDNPGTTYARRGGFIETAADFDADFFGISPREATAMDPQQRMLLEVAWEALEDAGVEPTSLRGTASGVFVGAMYQDYALAAGGASLPADLEGYFTTGVAGSVVSGRVAYVLGFEGPAITIDTACSSSLVSLHLACQALRRGECALALAGGASVMAIPRVFTELSRQRGLSRDGRCKAFSADADGIGLSEGVGLVALERLSDAQRRGRTILAVIRGSAVNQDGASNGLTAPNGPSQERVIRQALEEAQLGPADIDVIEAHGTGTPLGDPIEAEALINTYGKGHASTPVWLGSIKSNLGHTQAAAGVAGVLKMVLAMQNGVVPQTLHADRQTPHVDWAASTLKLATAPTSWTPGARTRRAAVSSFGISGTNAHLVLEEPPPETENPAKPEPSEHAPADAVPVVLSARTEAALRAQARQLESRVADDPNTDVARIGRALIRTRTSMEHRAVANSHDRESLSASLRAIAAGQPHPDVVAAGPREPGAIAFVFPGQGWQWDGMASELLERAEPFQASIRKCADAFSPYLEWSLEDVLRGVADAPSMAQIAVVQPVLFAISVSLAAMWRSFDVQPQAVTGHSQGEIAAAHVAGALSLDDAARLTALRSQIISRLAERGAMVSIALPAEDAELRLRQFPDAELAAVNGPRSVVAACGRSSIPDLLSSFAADNVNAREITATVPSHSRFVEELRDEVRTALSSLRPRAATIPFISAVTGQAIDTTTLDSTYWYRNLREPVQFQRATHALLQRGCQTFIEVSAHPVLKPAMEETFDSVDDNSHRPVAISSLRRGNGTMRQFMMSLAEAHAHGLAIDWTSLLGDGPVSRVPTYPFQRRRFWLPSTSAPGDALGMGQTPVDHPLLRAMTTLADREGTVFTGRLSLDDHRWIDDHRVLDTTLLPGTAFVDLALFAGRELGLPTLDDMVIEEPLVLAEGPATVLQIAVGETDEGGRRPLAVYARAEDVAGHDGEWTRHASGALSAGARAVPPLDTWPPAGASQVAIDDFYERMLAAGVDYGPAFQGVDAVWLVGDHVFADVSLTADQAAETSGFVVHPALLDAALHAGLAAQPAELRLPFAWSGVTSHTEHRPSRLRVQLRPSGEGAVTLEAFDEAGSPVISIDRLAARPLPVNSLTAAQMGAEAGALFSMRWVEVPAEPVNAAELAVLGATSPGFEDTPSFADVEDVERAVRSGDAQAPSGVVLDCRPSVAGPGTVEADASLRIEQTLKELQQWISNEHLIDARLAILTSRAVATTGDEDVDPAAAAIWGLVRSAQSEHPDRFLLIDADAGERLSAVVSSALTLDEPQLAERAGRLLAPRLHRLQEQTADGMTLDPEGTVLVTGGTGGLGSLVARHVATHYDVRNILVASRSGSDAAGAEQLEHDLTACGVRVTIAKCDVSDPGALEALLTAIPQDAPLTAVFHLAGALDDGVIGSLDGNTIRRVFEPKAAAAWRLHEFTKSLDLKAFVIFSSFAATIGSPGQANYAAANAFVDALAQHRRSNGLPAVSLGWGWWRHDTELTSVLDDTARVRLTRAGITQMAPEHGLRLLDRALATDAAVIAPVGLDLVALRAQAKAGMLPSVLRALVPTPARRRHRSEGAVAERILRMDGEAREAAALEVVRSDVAAVLGHEAADAIDVDRPFKDLGFDSLGAVDLRNRLAHTTGLRLPSTLVFDHPTPRAVARHLLGLLEGAARTPKAVNRRTPAHDEPIAIVGIGCRFPGGINSPDDLWRLVIDGREGVGPFPDDRGWDLDRLSHPDLSRPGTSLARHGGFIDTATRFDAAFFGVGPREALAMDPQQRLMLETTWHALEHAGIDPATLKGSETGVFAGVMHNDYAAAGGQRTTEFEGYLGTGLASSAVSGRVAYTFGFEGPAVTIDTACSSSLVALHVASRALRDGDCSLAVVGGVTVLSTPVIFTEFSRQRGLAADGRCKPFSAQADGAGFSDGVGVLIVERLSDARRRGGRILAIVRGTAVNQDGASNGFAAPNGPSQERVIRKALADAGDLAPTDVDAVEAHGTGTVLGDPIEAHALLATYGQSRSDGALKIGSIKSNIGHTSAAAGVAGVIKMTMALNHGALPKTLHIDRPSPHVDWDSGAVELLTEPVEWPRGERIRRAGVSSFGMSGTNAHVILEEAPAARSLPIQEGDTPERLSTVPWPISGRSRSALQAQAQRLLSDLRQRRGLDARDIALALSARSRMSHRAVLLGSDREALTDALEQLASGRSPAGAVHDEIASGGTAFLFPGQGGQRAGGGLQLRSRLPRFAQAIDEICEEFNPHLDRRLQDILFAPEDSPDAALLHETAYAQPALFTIGVALFRLLDSWNLRPSWMIGHSIGEIAAVHASGMLPLRDACRFVAIRGQLMGALPRDGAMATVDDTERQVRASLMPFQSRLDVAAVNGSCSVVVSGYADALEEWAQTQRATGRTVTPLKVSNGFHSPLMDPILPELRRLVATLPFAKGSIPVVSSLTGTLLTIAEASAPEYWSRQTRETVRFDDAITSLSAKGVTRYLELGTAPVLSTLAELSVAANQTATGDDDEVATARADRSVYAATFDGRGDELEALLRAVARIEVRGADVDWDACLGGDIGNRVDLPGYAFERERFWVDSAASGTPAAGMSASDHPLLAASVRLAGADRWLLTGQLSLRLQPWLADHAVGGTVIVPGAAFVEMALHAGRQASVARVETLTIEAPLVVPEDASLDVQVSLGAATKTGGRTVDIHARRSAGDGLPEKWTRHATGTLTPAQSAPSSSEEWPPTDADSVDVGDLYGRLGDVGLTYGDTFRAVRAAWRLNDTFYVEIGLDPRQVHEAARFVIHPALLDAAMHAAALGSDVDDARVPFSWRDVSVTQPGSSTMRVAMSRRAPDTVEISGFDETGAAVATVGGLVVRALPDGLASGRNVDGALLTVEWVPPAVSAPAHETEAARGTRIALIATDTRDVPSSWSVEHDFDALVTGVTEDGHPGPDLVVTALLQEPIEGRDVASCARERAGRTLDLLQRWLSEERLKDTRLAFVTRRTVAGGEGTAIGLAAAPALGLLRSAQSEHPGRIVAIDLDERDGWAQVENALQHQGEPQLALRAGTLLVPRLVPVARSATATGPRFEATGTVLITGGTTGLGATIARHLAGAHGCARLVLASRRGAGTPGVEQLLDELEELGCAAEVAACDVSDREALASLLAAMEPSSPLTAVVHAAGAIDDATIEGLDAAKLDAVMRTKVDGAWNLHELTRELDLSALVLFSSFAATVGAPGQGNYAGGNAFVEALAHRSREQGRKTHALGWGWWLQPEGLTGALDDRHRSRIARQGIVPLSPSSGTALFDRALEVDLPVVLPVALQHAALRKQARLGLLPPILRDMLPGADREPARSAGAIAARLAREPEERWEAILLEVVREEAAVVLGHPTGHAIDPERSFQEAGFDSLGALELRTRLEHATGATLDATLVFDHPNPTAIARHLRSALSGSRVPARRVATRKAPLNDDRIAIVGMACRMPGGVRCPEDLWRLVATGSDAIGPFPADRGWDIERLYDPDPSRSGTSYVRHGGFLDDVAGFDAEFFGVAPREALAMDPQQRLLLETAWEALEHAGIDPATLRGSTTGVYAGLMYHDYGVSLGEIPASVEGYLGIGTSGSVASGRIAYTLGLEGPAITVDTACSSSLVTLHMASQALRNQECSLALAGGATVLSTPAVYVEFSRQRGLAPDGRCKPFSAGADGAGWSEGVGWILLERMSDAHRNGHTVLAIVRGSAINQDGASNGLTAPNGPAQERVIAQALDNAELEPRDVDAIEAHGTGTPLGDPIEAQALLRAYGTDQRETPLRLGSVKSNIGHTQAAAGVAGVIKTVMAMRHETLPATLHVREPSNHIDWSSGAIDLLTEPAPWPQTDRPRRAGVSSFGISGTNAHVILEEPPAPRPNGEAGQSTVFPAAQAPLLLSAKTQPALREQAGCLHRHLESQPTASTVATARTLATSRSAFTYRASIMGATREDLLARLAAVARGAASPGVAIGTAGPDRTVFVFPGQGAQWLQMANELIEDVPSFATDLNDCEQALAPQVDWSLHEVLHSTEPWWLDQVEIVQPALFAIMVGLGRLWQRCGVQPAEVIGHSQGEIAAAHIAGALTLEDAALVVAARSKLLLRIAGAGGMVSVTERPEAVEQRLAATRGRLTIAAVNGPATVVVAGDAGALEDLLAECEREGVRARRVPVGYASHSAHVDTIEEDLLAALGSITPRRSSIPLRSTLTGEVMDTSLMGPGYWFRNLRERVELHQTVTESIRAGHHVFVEVSPHPVLALGVRETADAFGADAPVSVHGSLRRNEGGAPRFLGSLGEAHASGVAVDWRGVLGGGPPAPLPTYPFKHDRYWLASGQRAVDASDHGQASTGHSVLSATTELADSGRRLMTGRISAATHPWMGQQRAFGQSVVPNAVFVELAMLAGREANLSTIAELQVETPLLLPESDAVQIQVAVDQPDSAGDVRVSIHSRREDAAGDGGWTTHATGTLRRSTAGRRRVPLEVWPPAGATPLDHELAIDDLADSGFDVGPELQCIRSAWRRDDQLYLDLELPDSQSRSTLCLHPALIEAALHLVRALDTPPEDDAVMTPTHWRGITLHQAGAARLRATISELDGDWAVTLADGTGRAVADLECVALAPLLASQVGANAEAGRNSLFSLTWEPITLAPDLHDPNRATLGDLSSVDVPTRYAGFEELRMALDGGAPIPTTVFAPACSPACEASGDAVREAVTAALSLIQAWSGDERLHGARLVLVSAGAMPEGLSEGPDLKAAGVWGLVRSAQAENPAQLVLIDVDGTPEAWASVPSASQSDETQVLLRGNQASAGRLQRARLIARDSDVKLASGTVLITGGTGTLGRTLARHLVERHKAKHVVLASRRGPGADGIAEFTTALRHQGAEVVAVACDVADEAALRALVDDITATRRLSAVIHASGVLDDGSITALTPQRIDAVMRPKVDAALNLHNATMGLDLSAFVLFSSATATLGGPGQGGYAAGNACLDALAASRRLHGLPGQSIAWGLWEQASGMTSHLGDAGRARLARSGVLPLANERALRLFDAAIASDDAHVIPVLLDVTKLRSFVRAGVAPPLLRGIVGTSPAAVAIGTQAERLRRLSEPDLRGEMLRFVRSESAAVLGHATPHAVAADTPLLEVGFDSLAAVELLSRLNAETGLRVAPSTVFEHPTPSALANHLAELISAGSDDEPVTTDGTFTQMLFEARAQGRTPEFFELLMRAAAFRPSRSTRDTAPTVRAHRLTTGPSDTPRLIGFPTVVAMSGPHQFIRFARPFAGEREVVALSLPGFGAGEVLPASTDEVVDATVAAMVDDAPQECPNGILVAYSSGAVLALETAARLERAGGNPPKAVVLLDPIAADSRTEGDFQLDLLDRMLQAGDAYLGIDDTRLFAMGRYLHIFSGWQPPRITTPTLVVRAADRVGADADGLPWELDYDLIDVPGDHFTIIEQQAAEAAGAVSKWLSKLAARAAE